MFFKKKSVVQYSSFDIQSIDEMESYQQNTSYFFNNKFIKTVVIIVVSVHIIAIGYFALEGLISDFFKPKEKFITVNLTDFAAYSAVKSDTGSVNPMPPDTSTPDIPNTPNPTPENIVEPIATPVVTKEFEPQATTQPMFDAPTLAPVVKPKVKRPKPPKTPPKTPPRQPKPPRNNGGKTTKKNPTDKPWKRIGNPNGVNGGTSAAMKSYGSAVGKQLQNLFIAPTKQQAKYHILKVVVKVWVSSTGRVFRVQILKRSGNRFMDNAVTNAINKFYKKQLIQAPPDRKTHDYEITVTNSKQN